MCIYEGINMDNFTVLDMKETVLKIKIACDEAVAKLCEADAKIGDGDLGITMQKGWSAIAEDSKNWDDDLSKCLFEASKSLQRSCASSFGTLQATGFMTAAKYCKNNSLNTISVNDIYPIITLVYQSMMARGKGELGQKSVLDVLYNIALAFKDIDINKNENLKEVAQKAVEETLIEFKSRPNLLGRARMFSDKSIGLDDPGMLAIKVLVDAF